MLFECCYVQTVFYIIFIYIFLLLKIKNAVSLLIENKNSLKIKSETPIAQIIHYTRNKDKVLHR